jgi:arylsulfatase A-like enzyme
VTASSGRPNVLLINCDDLGFGDLGCYGSERNATPALDRLAAEGTRFTSLYMASPVCSPSRASLLTGCYPPRIGFGSFDGLPVLFPGMGIGLPPSEVSLARMLSDAGYATKMVGKWHCGDQPGFLPTNHGFDEYFGLPYSNDMGRQANTPEILEFLPPLPLLRGEEVIEQQPDQASLTGRYVAESLDFIHACAEAEAPFFLYLAHLYVHLPIYATPERLAASRNGAYGAAVESIDWATEVLMGALAELGLDESTIVIFTSDNGSLGDVAPPWGHMGPVGGSNAPLRGTKGTTFEGGLRVPAIVRWSGTVPAGHVSDELLSAMDLFPTLARLCGGEVPADRTIDGIDVTEVLLDDRVPSPRRELAYYRGNDLEAVRDQRFKLHVARGGEEVQELYDLVADVGETEDLSTSHPDVVLRLEALAEAFRRSLGDDRLGIAGDDVRPAGRVADPVPLTTYDPDHPYVVAEYDLDDRG